MATGTTNTAAELDGDTETLADETTQQAREVVASFSRDAEECSMFLSMLGIGPTPAEP